MFSKRGSHVGMILSFVIFVTFLIFLYSILQPSIQIREDKENLLDNLEVELTEKFSAEWGIITFVINKTTINNCVSLEGLVAQLPNSNVVVKNESSDIPDTVEKDNNNLVIVRSSVNNNFFKIYHSDEFAELTSEEVGSCEVVSEEDYLFKSVDTGKEIFYSKINKTRIQYEEDYPALKEELNIPDGGEFGFSFRDKEMVIETPEEETSLSVYAREIPVLYVDSEANIKSGFLIIKAW